GLLVGKMLLLWKDRLRRKRKRSWMERTKLCQIDGAAVLRGCNWLQLLLEQEWEMTKEKKRKNPKNETRDDHKSRKRQAMKKTKQKTKRKLGEAVALLYTPSQKERQKESRG